MRSTLMILRVVVVVGAILASGHLHGHLTQRWGSPQELKAAGRRLARAPEKFGPWKVQKSMNLPTSTEQTLQCEKYIYNRYVNEKTNEVVTAIVLLGPTGPIAVHTPEICYPHRDYEIHEARQSEDLQAADGARQNFWKLTLKSRDVDAHLLRVYYGWGMAGQWKGSSHPRLEYAFRPFLYKIQVACPLASNADQDQPWQQDGPTRDAGRDFLIHATAAMKKYLAN